jgi:hypothetical protein
LCLIANCDLISPQLGEPPTPVEDQNEVTNQKCQEFSQNENFGAMRNRAIAAVSRAAPMAEFKKEDKKSEEIERSPIKIESTMMVGFSPEALNPMLLQFR